MIIYVIYFISLLNQLVINGGKPVVSLYATQLGATPAEIGVIVSAFAVLPAILAVRIGQWIDRYGVRRMVVLGGIGMLLSLIASMAYPGFWTFVAAQALTGISLTGQVVALQKRIGQSEGDMEKLVAGFGLFGSIGAMVGPTLSSALYDHFGFRISFAVNSIIMLSGILIAFIVSRDRWDLPETAAERSTPSGMEKKESIWKMLKQRDLRNAVIISGLMLSNKEIFSAYFPLLGQKLNFSPTMIGIILSVMSAASVIVRMSQPYLVHRFGRGNVLTWAMYISGIIYLLTPSIAVAVLLMSLIAVLGAGLGIGQPLSLSYTIQVSPPERRGEVLGMRITFNRTSQLTIPLLFGGIGGIVGVSVIFWASGLLLLFGGFMTRSNQLRGEYGP